MGKFITHDAIASGVLNRDFNSATSTQAAWQGELLNSPQVLDLLLDRMGKDWSSLHVKIRKPYTAKDLDAWCCWVLSFNGYAQCFMRAGSSLLQSVQPTLLRPKQIKSTRRSLLDLSLFTVEFKCMSTMLIH